MHRFTNPAALALSLLATSAFAADPAAADTKLRESLRNSMLQLRTITAERDALLAGKAQLEADKKAAADQVSAMTKQLAADKDAADKSIAEFKDQAAQQEAQLAELKRSLEEWKAAQKKAADTAAAKEAERAKLAQQKIELERKVADHRMKNLAMYRIGSEVLERYQKFGLGTALAAREPFTGNMRVKLENLVQDYGDKLAEQRIKPEKAAAQR